MTANQNAIVAIGDTTIAASIELALFDELAGVSKAIGVSPSSILKRAIENWLGIEAPVYMARAARNADQQA